MSQPSEMTARHDRMLAELAGLGLALAANLQARALKAEDDAEAARLADSFHKVARSARQTMALEARLHREAAVLAREIAAEDERTRPARVERRKAEVRAAVERLVWIEVEQDETFEDEDDAELTVEAVAHALMEDLTEEDFTDTPAAVLVERIRGRIAEALRDLLRPWPGEGAGAGAAREPEVRNSA